MIAHDSSLICGFAPLILEDVLHIALVVPAELDGE
jgi:hypothetical protein